jgi:2Fe-2S ferredoxin
MQIALDNAVPGILGDCGGACSCATCHAYVDARWTEKLPAVSETEAFMLEGVPEPRANSRLCCQIKMQAALDGIVVQLPEVQV